MTVMRNQLSLANTSAFLFAVAALLVALCQYADAQQAGKVYRVGRLGAGLSSTTFGIEALRRDCGSSVTSRARTSSSSFATPKRDASCFLLWRMSLFV